MTGLGSVAVNFFLDSSDRDGFLVIDEDWKPPQPISGGP